MKHYDYIFAGAGLSALVTVYQMMVCGKFADKSILLIDQDAKKTNDRTWCYWEKQVGDLDHLVNTRWKLALFASNNFRKTIDLQPYEYKMIRGIDVYNFVFEHIASSDNIDFIQDTVTDISEQTDHCTVTTLTDIYRGHKILNSIFDPCLALRQQKYPILQQHFIGWFVQTPKPAFDPSCATFMDFSIPQSGNTRFMYVLPTSDTEALLEYTLFSKDLLATEEYENAIVEYLTNLGVSEYTIMEKERGSIPMTSYPFWKHNSKNIINIGSSGGWTKASTGYTFKNTLRKSRELSQFMAQHDDFTKFRRFSRFWFYDLLLLDILAHKNHLGGEIFSSMFRNAPATTIFKFLDEDTTPLEDLKVIWACPKPPFIAALLRRLFIWHPK